MDWCRLYSMFLLSAGALKWNRLQVHSSASLPHIALCSPHEKYVERSSTTFQYSVFKNVLRILDVFLRLRCITDAVVYVVLPIIAICKFFSEQFLRRKIKRWYLGWRLLSQIPPPRCFLDYQPQQWRVFHWLTWKKMFIKGSSGRYLETSWRTYTHIGQV